MLVGITISFSFGALPLFWSVILIIQSVINKGEGTRKRRKKKVAIFEPVCFVLFFPLSLPTTPPNKIVTK